MAEEPEAKQVTGAEFRLWETAINLNVDPIETSEFLVAAKECIEEGNACEVIDLITNDDYQELTKYVGWEMVAVTFPFLEKDHLKKDCLKILEVICQVCSPKEVLLGLSEQLHEISNIESFVSCLKFVQKVLLNLTQRRSKFIKMVCEDVSKQFARFTKKALSSAENKASTDETEGLAGNGDSDIGKLNISNDHGTKSSLEVNGEQPTPKDCTKTKQNIIQGTYCFTDDLVKTKLCCMAVASLDFIHPFINIITEEWRNTEASKTLTTVEGSLKEITTAVLMYIFNILEYPLSWYEVPAIVKTADNGQQKCLICNHDTKDIAERIMDLIMVLKIPFIDVMEYQLDESFLEETEESYLGIFSRSKAMMCYLIFVKDIGSTYFPFILSSQYLVRLCMKPIVELLKRTDRQGAAKAIDLVENMMNRVGDSSFSRQQAIRAESLVMFEVLIDIMVFRNEESLRKRALRLLHHTLKIYDSEGRLLLLRKLLTNVSHPGAYGVLVQCVIREADICYKANNAMSENRPIFSSTENFVELLELSLSVISLPDFDPLFQSDRILASLNLLRFLLIRIKRDETEITKSVNWGGFLLLIEKYLDSLRKSITISRNDHSVLLKETLAKKTNDNDRRNEDENAFTVAGFNANQISCDQQIQQVHIAMNTLDIMESLMGRISEILTEKVKPPLSVK